ncbi:MAG TPA: type II and III secretion system protein [Burkholderiales bacterium]|nr:type II and III secretion system protein [Burkholderiales bacterium]
MTTWKTAALATALATTLAACSQPPAKPSPTHLTKEVEAPAAPGAIPAPVRVAPALPKPQPSARPETYSVVVNNVRVQDLLFALARDARLNIDIHPGIAGSVTLNAIDQTLPALLERIARQIDMRYELDGPNLLVMRDSPFLRTYKMDFVSATRNVKMQSQSSTQFGGSATAGAAGAASSSTGTGATATIDIASNNQLWDTLVQNIRDILRDGPGAAAPAAAPQQPAGAAAQDAAGVIGNRESGVLFVRATARQHERIREFLDSVLANVRRQVLIEATIAEVQLNNEYQQGIDWQRLRTGATTVGRPAFGTGQSGMEFNQLSPNTPAGVSTTAFLIGGAITSQNLNIALRLLESFGDVRVLSSPKVSVLNNQTALLRVTRDIVYFTITPSQAPVTITSGGVGAPVVPVAFTTTPNVAAEGFMMSVLPQINEVDTIVLNVRPTIRRKVADQADPNPALTTVQNLIPVFETREFDSMLRMQSGQTAVLGGLMQDSVENIEDGIPGLSQIPFLRELFSQQRKVNRKTELVIFLRATVVRDASLDGDYQSFRELLPGSDFLRKPNPANPGRAQPSANPAAN